MPKLTELAAAFEVTSNTLRNWSSEFAPFLDAAANPPTGQRRRFTDNDAAVLALVASMRADDKPYEIIRAHLDAGERGQWPPIGYEPGQDAPHGAQNSGLVRSPFEAEIIRLRAQNELLERELEYHRGRAEELHTRAITAETQLMLLEPGGEGEEQPGGSPAPSLWQRIRRAWSGEE